MTTRETTGYLSVYGPRTLGARRDAQLILEVLQATNRWSAAAERTPVSKPIRELIWLVWEQPRLRAFADLHHVPLYRSKYPSWVPWSPGARRIHAQGFDERLVLEHVTPTRVIVRDLLAGPPQSPAALIKVLNRRLQYTVLSPDENRAITNAGLAWKLVDGDEDPWSRYRSAGLDLSLFAPLQLPDEA